MTIHRRTFVLNAAVSLCAASLATAARAAGPGYPSKPITIVFP